ncbi:MAG: DUF2784 family protein [Spirochaetaceae bacterium]|nr:MAG: DUF2784 family protein [Spirochaetaceae bacterium]
MDPTLLRALDLLFVVFHTVLILFNLLGWIPRRLRRANLIALLLTAASWLGLGIFYGIGFCPFTEWHWRVLRALGRRNLPRSYTQYLLQRLLGISIAAVTVDALTALGAAAALVISSALNIRDWRRRGVSPGRRSHRRRTLSA